ncbi:hypothetical protein W97_07688 [Coniosporium apollinis CBS 100218]|uniref:NAD-dependent epimerase/dehydratase domain-containing protein n=1 Tax=Coniosporium apollinis (strain CBS 100218) TaxID=1168221 RepID=R7Z309_CONA1|nr:uncharacterized protein W97_07688 [Coniosporium apollinis CBS 100218]EON68478.1 hypothetical protein W97_07688 [Coniosporium apollinis CBS 100218]
MGGGPMPDTVDLLILGAGWTSTFLIPLLTRSKISHAATTTTGRDNTIPFKFDPTSNSLDQYKTLPSAKTVLITFPLTGTGQSDLLTRSYRQIHGGSNNWIQLGSTGIYKNDSDWSDETSPYDTSNARAIAEDELLTHASGCVLNLAGLYGGSRDPKNWITRVAKTKAEVKAKGALHLIHGEDVARAILGVHRHFTPGRRWIITDLHVYDWWDLIESWGAEARERARSTMGEEEAEKLEFVKWVGELMVEEGVRALPRDVETLGRRLDSREFWRTVGVWPSQGRVR